MNNQGFKGIFKFNLSISRLVLTFMMLLIVVVGGTFAWFTFSSRESALVLTIGNINNTQITLSPYQVKEDNMSVGTSHTSGVYSEVTVKNSERANTVTLYYKINELDSTLVSKGLKYTITDSSGSTIIKTGDFSNASGGELVIYEDNVVSASSSTYRVYLWVDSSVGNQNDITGRTLDVELNGAIGSVKIRGTNTYGETLIADITDFQNNIVGDSATGSDYTYQWYYNDSNSTSGGTAISGATSRTYKIGEGLVGKYLYVVAKVSRGGTTITYTDITDSSSSDGDYSNNTAQVACRPLNKITAGSASKVYDGTGLTNATCTAETLLTGHSITCTMTEDSKITNVGSAVNKIATYTIKKGSTTIDSNTAMKNYCPVGSVANGSLTVTKASCSCTLTVDPSTLILPTHDPDGKATLVCVDTKSSSRHPDGNRYITSNKTNIVTVGTLTHTPSDFTNNSQITKSEAIYTALTTGTVTLTGGSEAGSNYNACSVNKTVTVRNNQFKVEYYYKEAMSGAYDIAGSSTHTYGATTGNKLTSAATLGIPTSAVTPYGWTFAGWTYNNDSGSLANADLSVFPVSSSNSTCGLDHASNDCVGIEFGDEAVITGTNNLTKKDGSTIKLYAVYKRTVEFKSGIGGATTSGSFEQKWNRRTITSGTVPSASQTTDIGNCWTELGYRNDTTAGTQTVNFGASAAPTFNNPKTYYAVYSRTVNFYSGQSNTRTPVTAGQYYNSSGNASIISGVSVTAISGWNHVGWTYSMDSNASELTGSSITPSVSKDCKLYAIYSKAYSFIFYHDVNKAKNTTKSGTVYYNTSTTLPTTVSVTAPTKEENTDITNWEELGYRDDTNTPATASPATDSVVNVVEIAFANPVIGTIGENKYYAVYSKDYSFIFYHGINKVSNTTLTGTVYYNTNTATVPTQTTVTAPTAANNTNITYWTELGYRDDTTAGDKEIAWSTSVTGTVGENKYYASYKRTISKMAGISYLYEETPQVMYYNSSNNMSELTKGRDESYNWKFNAWSTGSSASEVIPFTVTSSNSYVNAVYSRTITAYSGLATNTSFSEGDAPTGTTVSTQTQYYNSYAGDITSVALPTETSKFDFDKAAASLEAFGWYISGWITTDIFTNSEGPHDSTYGYHEYDYGSSSVTCNATNSDVTFYAMYKRSIYYFLYGGSTSVAYQFYTSTTSNAVSKFTSLNTFSGPSYWYGDAGFRLDTTAAAATYEAGTIISPGPTVALGVINGIVNSTNPSIAYMYMVFERELTFKSGQNYDTIDGSATQYYNAYGNLSAITTPSTTKGTMAENWEAIGYSDSYDYKANEDTLYGFGQLVIPPLELESSYGYNTLYAIYNREQEVWFYHGIDGDSDTTCSNTSKCIKIIGEEIYKPMSSSTSTQFTVNVPDATSLSSYDWETVGWRDNSEVSEVDSLADVKLFGSSITLDFNSNYNHYTYYAVYKRTLTAYSGQNTSKTSHEAMQYYNSSGDITYPTLPSDTNTSVTYNGGTVPNITTWNHIGWRDDDTVGNYEIVEAGIYAPDVNQKPQPVYAIYSRLVSAISLGETGTCTKTTYTATQYYSTAKASPGSLTLPNKTSSGSFTPSKKVVDLTNGWKFNGWREDTSSSVSDTTSYVGGVTTKPTAYAIYQNSATANFYYGSKESNTSISRTSTVYHSAYKTCSFATTTTVTTPAKTDVNNLTSYGWDAGGFYKNPPSSGVADASVSSTLTLDIGTSINYYTRYWRVLEAYGGVDASWLYQSGQDYYSNGSLGYVYMPDLANEGCGSFDDSTGFCNTAKEDGIVIDGWGFLGWRDDSVAAGHDTTKFPEVYLEPDSADCNNMNEIGEDYCQNNNGGYFWKWTPAVTSSATTAYAVYDRDVKPRFYHGVNRAAYTDKSTVVYYNNSTGALPTTTTVTSPTKAENTDITGWTELGYRDDRTDGVKEYDFNKSVTVNIDNPATFYAVYSRDYSTVFYHGLDASGNNTLTGTVYYNTYTTSLPTTTKVTAPTSVPALGNCWTSKGYKKEDTTANTTGLINFGTANIEVSISGSKTVDTNSTKFYAVYERSVTFKSGLDEGTTHSPTRTQYYNSANTDSSATGENVSPISTFTGTSINPVGSVTTGWTFKGWRDDKTASTPEYTGSSISPYANVNCILYAVYERSVTFKSGLSAGTTHSPARTQYYNSANTNSSYTGENVSSISTFTATSISGWTFKGWRDDTTASTPEYTGSSISPYANSSNTLYAVYSRSYSVKFYHGVDGDSDTSCSNSAKCINTTGTKYYNSSGSSLPTTFSVDVPTAAQTTNITGWSELGYKSDEYIDDIYSSDVKMFGSSLTLNLGTTYEYYAVYERTVTAYSGINKATTHTATQYYNTSGEIQEMYMPDATTTGGNDFETPSENDDDYVSTIGATWNFTGWCDDSSTTGNCFEWGIAESGDGAYKWTPALTDTTPYAYAIYEREIVAWSGVASGAYHTPEVEHKGNQYYNSYNTISTMTMPKTNSPGSFTTTNENLASISGWTHNGWRNDRTANGTSTLSTNSSGDYVYTPAVGDTPSIMYAIYIISYEARFYMGVNGDSDTNCTNTSKCIKRSGYEYYNSYLTDVPAGKSVSAPSASNTTGITSWNKRAYSDSPSSYDVAVEFSSSISISLGGITNFYAIYYRSYDVRFYHGQYGVSDKNCTNTSKCIRHIGTVSYNTSESTLPTTVPSPLNVPTAAQTTDITNWTEEGYRADTTAADNTITFGSTVTPSLGDTSYYAVYSRQGYGRFYHGVNKANNTTITGTAYYNTNSSTLPTQTTIAAATASQNTNITGWTELGYRDDTDDDDKEISFGGSVTIDLGTTTNYYAVYKKSYSATFYHGENKSGNTPVSGDVYYNTNTTTLPTTVDIDAPDKNETTAIVPIDCWIKLGYRDDTSSDAAEIDFDASVTIPISTGNNFYAVYSANYSATFYHGVNKASNTPITGTVYYNANTTSVPITVSRSAPTASQNTNITNWTEEGYRNDKSSLDNSISFGGLVDIIICPDDVEETHYYAVYSRSGYGRFYHGVNKASNTTITGTAYYNTNTTSLPTTTTISAPTASQNTNISGWTEEGYRSDTYDADNTIAFSGSVTITLGTTTNFYAVYSDSYSATFYHGENKSGNNPISGVVYYNTNTTTLPTTVNIAAPASVPDLGGCWTELGYRDDTSDADKEIDFGDSVTIPISTGNYYYAVYSANYSATFYHGVNEASNTPITGTEYYNTNTTSVPITVSRSAPTASQNTNITNWTEEGYRNDKSSLDNSISFGGSVDIIICPDDVEQTYYYAVYSRDTYATFYHGVNQASNTPKSKTTYYNTNTASLPTTTTIAAATAAQTTDISGWSEEGYRSDTSDANNTISFGGSITVSIGSSTTYYAVYSDSYRATFYHGIYKSGNTPVSGYVYYNTSTDTLPTETSISVPGEYTPITDWSIFGYRDDTDDAEAEISYGGSVTIPISTGIEFYAVYNKMYTAYFTKDVNGYDITRSGVGYYNTNTYTLPDSWRIYAPAEVETYTVSNWSKLGYRDDTDNAEAEIYFGGAVDVPFGYSYYYAVYGNTGTAKFHHGIDKAGSVTRTGLAYYNIGSSSSIPTSVSITTPASSQVDAIDGWTKWGYNSTTSPSLHTTFNASIPIPLGTTTEIYTVYYRYIYAYSGTNSSTIDSSRQVYNTSGEISSVIFPSSVGSVSGFSHIGWCVSLDMTAPGLCAETGYNPAFGINPGLSEFVPTYYAVYRGTLRYTTGFYGESSAVDDTMNRYYISSGQYVANIPPAATVSGWLLAGWTETGFSTDSPDISSGVTVYTGSSDYISSLYTRTVNCLDGVGVYDYNVSTLYGAQYRSYSNSYYNVLPTSSHAPSNWSFAGWNDSQTAAAPYGASSSSSNVFYAVYSRTKIISYDTSGGRPVNIIPTIIVIYIAASSDPYVLYSSQTSARITSQIPTLGSYSFKWWVSSTSPVQKVSSGGTLNFSYIYTDSNDYNEWFGDDSYWNVTMVAEY